MMFFFEFCFLGNLELKCLVRIVELVCEVSIFVIIFFYGLYF